VNIEVINAAVGGYVAADNLKNLQHRVLPLDPDLVIYYEANNEIVHDTQLLAIQQGLLGADGRRQSALVSTSSKASLLFDLAYKNLSILLRSRDTSTPKINEVPANLPDHFIGELDQMRAALAERHVPFVLSTFSREVPARSGSRHPDRERRCGVLLHAVDEHRRHARRHGPLQRRDCGVWQARRSAGHR
jgi:hypothetical protein